ncbi:MAG: phage major capsid protein [Candidatus Bilamarchaeaceae archaeon]
MDILEKAKQELAKRETQKQINAPFINKGKAAYIKEIPQILGYKSIAHMFGYGHGDEMQVMPVNLGAKLPASIDKELASTMLELKKHLHSATIQAQMLTTKSGIPVDVRTTPYFKRWCEPLIKAYNITDFNDWIPTLNTRFYFEELEVEPGISSLFPQYPMTSSMMNVPTVSGRLMGELETDSGTFTEQSETDGKITLVAKNNVAHVKITEDLIQDAEPSLFERLRVEVAQALARSRDNAILNGDDSATHMDSDTTAAKDFRKAWKGVRKLSLDNPSSVYNHNGARCNFTLFQEMYRIAGKMRYDKGDCLWILGLAVEGDAVSGKIPELLTFDKAASNATLFSGILPVIMGIRPVVSQWIREDLAATGVHTGTGTLTVAHLVRLSGFAFGVRSPMRIWAAPSLPNSDTLLMTAKERIAFGCAPQSATNMHIVTARNIATQ